MSDLISRQAAIDAVNRLSIGETDAIKLAFKMGDYLKRIPDADVATVIRCKDCKKHDYCAIWDEAYFMSDIEHYGMDGFYCAFAERRENEAD